jgi:subtilisin family serine protease
VRWFAPLLAAVAAALALPVALGTSATARTSDTASDALIHVDATRALGYTGKGVTVAILDTGIDDRNPAIAPSVVAEHCFVPLDGCPNGTAEQDGPGSAQDDEGHGTAMATVIAGRGGSVPLGVAPDASLVVVKVADHNGRTTAGQVIDGLNWVRVNHPEVKVVNVSIAGDVPLSGDCGNLSDQLRGYAQAIAALRAQGTTVFAASGNNGAHNGMPAPACVHDAVAVGAVYSRAFGPFTARNVCRDAVTAADEIACFSNRSSELDLLAAGAPVDAIGLNSQPLPIAGTSAASAQASGVAAILLQADPTLGPDGLLSVLETTGAPIGDGARRAVEPRIDAAAALGAVLGTPVPLLPAPDLGTPPPAPALSAPTVPRIAVSKSRVSFGSVRRLRTATRTVLVKNTGSGFLDVSIATSTATVSARPARLTVAASRSRKLVLTFRPVRPGAFRASVRLETNDPQSPTVVVAISGSGRA